MAAKDTDTTKTEDQNDAMGDMSQAAVKKMISEARTRGYITYDELNKVLPPDQVSSEQIEDVMSMLSEMGINIIEDDEVEEEEQKSTAVVELNANKEVALARARTRNWIARMIRCACICVKWAVLNCSAAKVKSRLPNASRRGATR